MKKTLIALSIAGLASPLYAQIQGKVLDQTGLPINQASVEVVGSETRVQTNEQGEFALPVSKMSEVELHIKARDYIHKTFHVRQGSQQDFVLSSSAIDVVNITGLPMHQSNLESSQPVNVISADELRDQQSSSLGEALKNEPGIHSSYYSSNSASPIIRGLDGSRVLIAQNGLDAGDASRVGPDHAVSAETSYAQQIEVLRGPATLFYGSGAIGGVVNIVDDRIPKGTDIYGEWRLENHSVANDKLISASGNTGVGNFGLHADGFWRDADDYKIPGPAELHHDHEDETYHQENRLLNSWTEASGGNLGASYIDDEGYIGISVGQLNRQYGIPGHSHGEESVNVYADLEQTRWQLQGKRNLDSNWFSSTGLSAGYTDYQHAEIEGTEVGTTFKNKTSELRWELFHQPINDWRGAISLHYKLSDFEASGEEAFTPPSKTKTLALGLMEEKHIDSLLLQLGARLERIKTSANQFTLDFHQPDEDEHHSHNFSYENTSTAFSFSAGAVWDFTPGYNAAISLTHAQRAPAASEILSYGPHIGSGLYEIGYLFPIHHHEDDEHHVELNTQNPDLEKSNNLDISLRKHSGNFGFILNGFFNRVDNFYYLTDTGLTRELEEHHHHEDESDHEHEEEEAVEFPVFAYQTGEVDLWGYEAEFIWQATNSLELKLTTDSIRAQVDNSHHLPRIPPRRYGLSANYEFNKWRFNLSGQYYDEQNRITELETKTNSYFLLDTVISYSVRPDLQLFIKGYNLTDEYARVHNSFLKDKAPLPGRNIALGISGRF